MGDGWLEDFIFGLLLVFYGLAVGVFGIEMGWGRTLMEFIALSGAIVLTIIKSKIKNKGTKSW